MGVGTTPAGRPWLRELSFGQVVVVVFRGMVGPGYCHLGTDLVPKRVGDDRV